MKVFQAKKICTILVAGLLARVTNTTEGVGGPYHYVFENVRTGTVDISVTKNWVDSNYHSTHIKDVTMKIYRRLHTEATGEYVGEPIVLNGTEATPWRAEVTGLSKYDEKGVLYLYDVHETCVTETVGDIKHEATDGESLYSYELDAAEGEDPQQYVVGITAEREYGEHNPDLDELTADNYAFTVTNSRSDTVSFKAYVLWKDIVRTRNFTAGKEAEEKAQEVRNRPDVYLRLYSKVGATGTPSVYGSYVESEWTTSGAPHNEYYWMCSFADLPRYTSEGEEIFYFAEQVKSFRGEYVTTGYSGAAPELVQDETEAALATLTHVPIYDVATGAAKLDDNGAPAQYTVSYSVDGATAAGTCAAITEDLANQDANARAVTVKNNHTPKTMGLTVTKVWDDADDLHGLRPASIKLQLMSTTNSDGKTGAQAVGSAVTVNKPSSGPWQYTWTNLPVMANATGTGTQNGASVPIYYSVVELTASGATAATPLAGYKAPALDYALATSSAGTVKSDGGKEIAISGSVEDADATTHAVELKNTLDTLTVTAEKTWTDYGNLYDSRPAQLVFEVQRRGANSGDAFATAVNGGGTPIRRTVSSAANGTAGQTVAFTDLPKCAANGTPWEYRVVETAAINGGPEIALTPKTAGDFTSGSFTLGDVTYEMTSTTTKDSGGNYTTAVTNKLDEEMVSLSGTKTWEDSGNAYLSRPETLVLTVQRRSEDSGDANADWQEYGAAHYQVDWTKNNDNTWTYTIPHLPKYVPGEKNEWEYRVAETVPDHYTQTLPAGGWAEPVPADSFGNLAGADFTNKLNTGAALVVEKKKDRGPADVTFAFTVYISPAPITVANPGAAYMGSYKVFDKDADITGAAGEGKNTINGQITIKAGQKFVLENLPLGFYYEVEEDFHEDYLLKASASSGLEGRLPADDTTVAEALVMNHAKSELAIENTTVNPDINTGGTRTDIGGKVVVMEHDYDVPNQNNMDDFKLDCVAVAWMPDEHWVLGDSFTVYYTEFGSTQEHCLVVSQYVNKDGSLKLFADCEGSSEACMQRFIASGASLCWSDCGAVKLLLANNADDMPRVTRVAVEFLPTLGANNATPENAGGVVSVEGGQENPCADGVPAFGGKPYRAQAVYGRAADEHCVDVEQIVVRNLNDLEGPSVALEVADDGSFQAVLPMRTAAEAAPTPRAARMARSAPEQAKISGKIEAVLHEEGHIAEVRVAFDTLPVPLQVDVVFAPASAGGTVYEEPPAWAKPPQTGDSTNVAVPVVLAAASLAAMVAMGMFVHGQNKRKRAKARRSRWQR